jgi:hypothetical protein
MNKGVSVRYDSGAKEPLPICLPYEQPFSLVTATNLCMDALQNSTAFVWGDTFH